MNNRKTVVLITKVIIFEKFLSSIRLNPSAVIVIVLVFYHQIPNKQKFHIL